MSVRGAGVALLLASLAGCDTSSMNFCSAEFRAVPVTLVDAFLAPVSGATVTTTLIRTGRQLTPSAGAGGSGSHYIVIDDMSVHALRNPGDSVRVSAVMAGVGSASAVYFIGTSGGCHVSKISGPDTLVVR